MARRMPKRSHWLGMPKQRCSHERCNKRAIDFNPPLCRIHSPIREGYKKDD